MYQTLGIDCNFTAVDFIQEILLRVNFIAFKVLLTF